VRTDAEIETAIISLGGQEAGIVLISYGCVYRKLKLGRSGDEVRPGWHVT
jgi:hypothetical protein